MSNMTTSEPLLYSRAETSKLLGVSEMTVRRLIARGELRRVRAIRRCRISKKEIERFIDESSKEAKFHIKMK